MKASEALGGQVGHLGPFSGTHFHLQVPEEQERGKICLATGGQKGAIGESKWSKIIPKFNLEEKIASRVAGSKNERKKVCTQARSLAKLCVLCRRNTLFQLLHFGVKRYKRDIKIVLRTLEFAIHGQLRHHF